MFETGKDVDIVQHILKHGKMIQSKGVDGHKQGDKTTCVLPRPTHACVRRDADTPTLRAIKTARVCKLPAAPFTVEDKTAQRILNLLLLSSLVKDTKSKSKHTVSRVRDHLLPPS